MRERPILFSGPMVRALLAGTKTQTRRIVKPQPAGAWAAPGKTSCPYGQPGDRLWVRETWARNQVMPIEHRAPGEFIYGAELNESGLRRYAATWKPSIHMPRAACRLVLEITGVRVERLHQISEADAIAEGIPEESAPCERCGDCGWLCIGGEPQECDAPGCGDGAIDGYRALWEQINGAGSWAANPWVWVVEFRRADTDKKEM